MFTMPDGRRYDVGFPVGELTIHSGVDGVEIRARLAGGTPVMEEVDRCGKCGRFDVREVVCWSWDEAIARGWLVPA